MILLNENDKLLLEEIQNDIPLISSPFTVIADKCKMNEIKVLEKLKLFLDNNLIRDISALIDASKIGYKNTLVALKVKTENIKKVSVVINAHPGVSHNYLREHAYNIWFTLSIEKEKDFQKEISTMLNGTQYEEYIILPAIQTFKLKVHFNLTGHEQQNESIKQNIKKFVSLNDKEKWILVVLQQPFPLVHQPFMQIAQQLDLTEQQLRNSIEKLKQKGVIKRIVGMLRHRHVGFSENNMLCFNIPNERIKEAGNIATTFNEISHCYQRPVFPNWPYSLFCMTHAQSKERANELMKEISKRIKCNDYIALKSIKEFKKERVKYFI